MKTEVVFNIYPGHEQAYYAKAIFIDGVYTSVKLVTKVGRSGYTHFLNDAGLEAERLFLN